MSLKLSTVFAQYGFLERSEHSPLESGGGVVVPAVVLEPTTVGYDNLNIRDPVECDDIEKCINDIRSSPTHRTRTMKFYFAEISDPKMRAQAVRDIRTAHSQNRCSNVSR